MITKVVLKPLQLDIMDPQFLNSLQQYYNMVCNEIIFGPPVHNLLKYLDPLEIFYPLV